MPRPAQRSAAEQELILEYARRWRSLHDTWQPPPKPLPPADLMEAAERWHRERLRARAAAEQEAERRRFEEATRAHRALSLDSQLSGAAAGSATQHRKASQLNSALGRVVLADRAATAFATPGGDAGGGRGHGEDGELTADGDGGGGDEEKPEEEMQGTGAPADAQARRLSHEPTSPRSPAGSRRLRCTLGKDRRMLLVPRCASFEEVLDLAKAKFEVREKRARLLCPDPQCPDDLITLTCDADYEFMRNEHGEKLALHLELFDAEDAEGAPGDSQTPAKSSGGAKMGTPGTPGTVPGEMIMGAFAEVFAQAFSRSMMSNPSPAAFQPRTPPYAPPPPPPAAPPTQPPPAVFAPPPPMAPPPMAPPPLAPPPLAPPPLAPTKAVSPPPPPPPPPRAAAAADEPPTAPKEKRGGGGSGPLYVQGYRPEVVKKTRHPKQVQKGLEAAFRKRQNLALKERRDEVVAALRRVAFEPLEDEGALRRLFTEVSEYLSQVIACGWPLSV